MIIKVGTDLSCGLVFLAFIGGKGSSGIDGRVRLDSCICGESSVCCTAPAFEVQNEDPSGLFHLVWSHVLRHGNCEKVSVDRS